MRTIVICESAGLVNTHRVDRFSYTCVVQVISFITCTDIVPAKFIFIYIKVNDDACF